MTKKKKDDLADFQDWLMKEQAIARRTASVYASRTRKILLALPEISTVLLDGYIADQNKRTHDGIYTSWRKFAQYCQSKGIAIPMPTKRERRAKDIIYDIPPIVLKCLLKIRKDNRIPWEAFPKLRHSDCKKLRRSKWYEIADPNEPWKTWKVSERWIDPIKQWGDPLQDHPNLPLLPISPCLYEPIPIAHLRKLLREYKRATRS